jgi:peroxiredoxin Q/BCP
MKAGSKAPDFSARTADGQQIQLSQVLGQRGLVLFFYPKDGTRICTAEACAFRDSYEKFVDAGFEVIGISSDSQISHQQFAERNALPFPLISDSDGALRKLFNVPRTLGLLPGRATYVIDRDGIICHIYSAALASDNHVTESLDAISHGSPQGE